MTTDAVFAIFKIAVLLVVLAYAIYTMLRLRQIDAEHDEYVRRVLASFANRRSPFSMPTWRSDVVITKVLDATDDLTGDRYIHAMIEYDVEHWYPCRGFDVTPQAGDRAWFIMPMDDVYYLTP